MDGEKTIYTYYKKRRDSRHWWRRIQSRKYRRELIVRSILVVIVTATMYLLASLNSGRNDLYLLAWCLIVGIILIPFMLNLRVSKAQKPKSTKADAVLLNTENEKEKKGTPSRIIQISQQQLKLKKDRHTQSTKGMA